MLGYELDIFPQISKNSKATSKSGYVLGIDEAGRGPLAGPMVVAGVVLDIQVLQALAEQSDSDYHKINDSKKLSEKKRGYLYDFITSNASSHEIEIIPSDKIDEWGISRATQIAFFNIANKTIKKFSGIHVLTDTFRIDAISEHNQTNIVRGDQKSVSIAAASILAKVTRDRIMEEIHSTYPMYLFNKHKGYGTKQHIDLIKLHGPCDIHRKSFAPIKSL